VSWRGGTGLTLKKIKGSRGGRGGSQQKGIKGKGKELMRPSREGLIRIAREKKREAKRWAKKGTPMVKKSRAP